MSWTSTIFSFGTSGTLQNAGTQTGTMTGVLVDGSTNTLTFTAAFAHTCTNVLFTVKTTSTTMELGAPQLLTLSASGCTFTIPGGQPGATATVIWTALGS